MCITEYDEVETMQQFKEEGRKEGEDKLAKLINALISAGRMDDVSKATSDTAARAAFYTEFDIA